MAYSPVQAAQSDDYLDKESEDLYIPKRRSALRRVLYYSLVLLFAGGGWLLALDFYRRPRFVNYPGLSSPHPFPPEVFTRVKRVFEPDSRYIGPSNQTHQNWDHLVAGKKARGF